MWLQQYLPLAVLKLEDLGALQQFETAVATVLTACGIETFQYMIGPKTQTYLVATVLTACGIETSKNLPK